MRDLSQASDPRTVEAPKVQDEPRHVIPITEARRPQQRPSRPRLLRPYVMRCEGEVT
jgi:hypothetical protein